MIELKNVNVAYGNIKALHDINLIARPGEITAVLGANGAGKSSLLKAIAGAVPSASGAVMINNEDLTRLPAHLRARKGVSLAQQVEQRAFAGGVAGSFPQGEALVHKARKDKVHKE